MKILTLSLMILLGACGSSSTPPAAPAAAPVTAPAAEVSDTGDTEPLFQANLAATDWNMATTGQVQKTEAEMAELVARTKAELKRSCDEGNVCGCNALKTGNCECPDEPSCAGEPFWFVSGND